MKCKSSGRRVRCPEHGSKYVVEDFDPWGLPFYYCSKCVEEYDATHEAILHEHSFKAVFDAIELLVLARMMEKKGEERR